MTVYVLVTPCLFYMDVDKLWYGVKPVSPEGLMFFVYKEVNTILRTITCGEAVQQINKSFHDQIRQKLNLPEAELNIQEVEPEHFMLKLTDDDRKVSINPKCTTPECDHGNGD